MPVHSRTLSKQLDKHFGPDGPATMVEVGVASGKTSHHLLSSFPLLRLWMVDPWKAWHPGDRYYDYGESMAREHESQDDWERLYQRASERTAFAADRRTIIRHTSREAAGLFANMGMRFDCVFIDGDHSYEGCKEDIHVWSPLVLRGGVLCGHDYGATDFRRGVTQAVDEAAERNGWQVQDVGSRIWWVDL